MDVGWFGNVTDHIFADQGAGLIAQRVDASAVVHVLGIVVDKVGMHLIILHADEVTIPAPTE